MNKFVSKLMMINMMSINRFKKIIVFYYHIIKDLNILSPHIIKMKKQKSTTMNISEVSSSDDESQAKPKIDKEELKKYIKDSDDESGQEQITPKSSPQK